MAKKSKHFLSVKRDNRQHPIVEIHRRKFKVNKKQEWRYCLRGLLELFNHIAKLRGWDLQKVLENVFDDIRENRQNYINQMDSILSLPNYKKSIDEWR